MIVKYLKLDKKTKSLSWSYCCIVSSYCICDILAVLCIMILLKCSRGSQRPEVNTVLPITSCYTSVNTHLLHDVAVHVGAANPMHNVANDLL